MYHTLEATGCILTHTVGESWFSQTEPDYMLCSICSVCISPDFLGHGGYVSLNVYAQQHIQVITQYNTITHLRMGLWCCWIFSSLNAYLCAWWSSVCDVLVCPYVWLCVCALGCALLPRAHGLSSPGPRRHGSLYWVKSACCCSSLSSGKHTHTQLWCHMPPVWLPYCDVSCDAQWRSVEFVLMSAKGCVAANSAHLLMQDTWDEMRSNRWEQALISTCNRWGHEIWGGNFSRLTSIIFRVGRKKDNGLLLCNCDVNSATKT